MNSYDELLSRVDLVQLAEQAGSQMRRVHNEWRGPCPLHGGDNPTGFVIYEADGKQKWHCYTRDCGSGDAIDFYAKLYSLSNREAYELLGGKNDIDPDTKARLALEKSQRAQVALEESIRLASEALKELREADQSLIYHQNLAGHTQLWRNRGVPDEWQNFWDLGYRSEYKISTPEGWWSTPTLTIPIYEQGKELVNIRHRLINPYSQNDKYRPERSGLKASPFICDYDEGWDKDKILVVEGEIKAMVTYLTLDSSDYQVIGIPGKTSARQFLDKIKGHTTYWLLDPDAEVQAREYANITSGRFIVYPVKIDDAILSRSINAAGIKRLLTMGRRA